jgi:hypothetical protein
MNCLVCYGEYIDKMTILEVKLNKIRDSAKLENVKKEYSILRAEFDARSEFFSRIESEKKKLYILNWCLWNIEDGLRIYEKNGKFDGDFVDLARCVYLMNDKRNFLKNAINRKLDSSFLEVKSYDYLTLEGAKKRILIIPHQGLGDIIMCSAIYRFYDYDHDVVVIAPEKSRGTLPQLLIGTNIQVEYINKDGSMEDELREMVPIIEKYSAENYQILPLGIHRMAFGGKPQDFSSCRDIFWHLFYGNAGMPYSMMNYGFYLERNTENEQRLYNELMEKQPEAKDGYIIINDDPSRCLGISEKKIVNEAGLTYVYFDKDRGHIFSKNLCDYLTILERAAEYHSFDTAYSWIFQLSRVEVPKKVIHTYVRDTLLFTRFRYLERLYGEFLGKENEWSAIN